MDKKTIAAVVLSIGIWLVWQKAYWEPYQQEVKAWKEYQQKHQKEQVAKENSARLSNGKTVVISSSTSNANFSTTGSSTASDGKPVVAEKPSVPAKITTLDLDNSRVLLSNSENLLSEWRLEKFKEADLDDSSKTHEIDLKHVTGIPNQLKLNFSDSNYNEYNLAALRFTVLETSDSGYSDKFVSNKLEIERVVTKDESPYTLNVLYKLRFKQAPPGFVFFDLNGSPKRENDADGSILGGFPDKVELLYWGREGREASFADGLEERLEEASGIHWVGINTRYFLLSTVVANKDLVAKSGVQFVPGKNFSTSPAQSRLVLNTDKRAEIYIPLKVYFGPKQLEYLEAVSPSLTNAVDFGWTTVIAVPLLKALKWFYSYSGNYGIAIILLTLVVKILLFPLTYKSMKSMAKIAKLKPEMEKLQEKYKEDKQKLQQELLNLYKVNGANPVSGCFPMLLQMPVFFALYRVLFNCMELYQAPFFGWLQDLSAADPYYVTPVLLIVLMYLQQRLMPTTTTDPNQQMIMRFMPVMFGVFMLFLPAGLNIYMLVNTIFSVAQQHVLNKKFGLYDNMDNSGDASSEKKRESKEALSGA